MPFAASTIAVGRIGEKGAQDRQRLRGTALEPPPQLGDLARIVQIPAIESCQQSTQPVLVLAVAGDLQPRVWVLGLNQRPRGDQQIDPLGDDQLPDEDDAESLSVRPRGRTRGRKRLRVDAGRTEAGLLLQARDVWQRRPQRLRRVPRADEDAAGGVHALFGIGQKAWMRFDRVLERRAVDLGGEGADLGAGEDRRAHDQVTGQRRVDAADARGDLADSSDVGVDVAIELRRRSARGRP